MGGDFWFKTLFSARCIEGTFGSESLFGARPTSLLAITVLLLSILVVSIAPTLSNIERPHLYSGLQ